MRYFIWFSYDGTNYHGWQVQPNGVTVQSELERCLSLLLRETITVTGAGRTDAGVHARQMAAHFDTDAVFEAPLIVKKLNGLLSHDISVDRIETGPQGSRRVERKDELPPTRGPAKECKQAEKHRAYRDAADQSGR